MPGTLPVVGTAPTVDIVAFFGSFYAWGLFELYLQIRIRRAGSKVFSGSSTDRGSLYVILLSVWISLAADFALSATGVGALPAAVFWPGIAVTWAGIALRAWAVRTLGRFFSLVVRIRGDHLLVREGPYRIVRHPAYTGSLLSLLGISVSLETAPGLVLTAVAMLASYLYRIHVEEAGLHAKFGPEFVEYAKTTWRLLPYIY